MRIDANTPAREAKRIAAQAEWAAMSARQIASTMGEAPGDRQLRSQAVAASMVRRVYLGHAARLP